MNKALLIGACPIQDTSFLHQYQDCYKIACDGGYQAYKENHIEVDLFVGDYDTFKKEELVHPKEVISLDRVKDDTDTLFAIKHALQLGYDTFYLYGCLGGKIDHSIANMQLLLFLRKHNAKGYLFDDKNHVLLLLENETLTLKESEGYLSIFAIDNMVKGVSLKNLKYELNNAMLTNDFPLGISNEFLPKQKASITIKEGRVLVYTTVDSLI